MADLAVGRSDRCRNRPRHRLRRAPHRLTVAILVTLPVVPIAMLLARVHPRIGRLLACGALYGAAALIGIVAVVAAIERFFGKRVIEQTGLICWFCDYNLGSPTIVLCPECGKAFDPNAQPPAASPRLLALLVRVRWGLAALALLVAIGPMANVLATHTLPAARFILACPAAATLQSAGMMGNHTYRSRGSSGSARVVSPVMYGWWIPDAPGATLGLAVQYVPQAQGNEPGMYISRAHLYEVQLPAAAAIDGPGPKDEMLAPGTARIVARLSRAQAASVIESRAVPAGLAEAITREDRSQGWTLVDPMVTPAAQEVAVQADPFFSPRPADPAADRTP